MTLQAVLEREREKSPMSIESIPPTEAEKHLCDSGNRTRDRSLRGATSSFMPNYFFPSGDAIHFFLASLDVDMEKPDTRKDRPITDQVQLLLTL